MMVGDSIIMGAMTHANLYLDRDLKQLGVHIRNWRKVRGMTAVALADRAGISRSTLRSIETGEGTTKLASVMSVAAVLGINRILVDSIDPLRHDLGQARAYMMNRERIR